MASLVPCTACRRHVRRHETQCRFCGAELKASASLLREVAHPRHVKRATLFALGLTLAGQACGGQSSDEDTHNSTGGNGNDGFGDGGTGFGGTGTGGTGAAPNNAGGNGNQGSIQPVYGAPVPPVDTGGSSGSTGLPDASPSRDAGDDAGQSDAAAEDAGN